MKNTTTPSNFSRIIAFDPRGLPSMVRVPALQAVVTMLHNMKSPPMLNGRLPMNCNLESLLENCRQNIDCRFFFFLNLEEELSVTTHILDTAVSDSDDIEYVRRYTGFGDEKEYVVERFTDPIKWFKAGLEISAK